MIILLGGYEWTAPKTKPDRHWFVERVPKGTKHAAEILGLPWPAPGSEICEELNRDQWIDKWKMRSLVQMHSLRGMGKSPQHTIIRALEEGVSV